MFKRRAELLLGFLMLLLLAACQTTIRQMNDCRAGDWRVIGSKDGLDALGARYEERRAFCADVDGAKLAPDAPANYQLGWAEGNAQFWRALGSEDGRKGLDAGQFGARLASHKVTSNKTPPNQDAYAQGWREGNAAYWRELGLADGKAGRPGASEQQRAAEGGRIGFNAASWGEGWREGNFSYWAQAGFQDAHDGIAARELDTRAAKAKAAGLQVREDAYRQAWNREIVEYWRRLGWQDATDGRDAETRRADARQRGLPFAEAEYRQQWQARLQAYWAEVGKADGFGQPNRLEERIANARRDNVYVIADTRALYNQAWSARNAEYCRVDNAFEFGRREETMATELCQGREQDRARRAWLGGRDYTALARRAARVERELDSAHERRRSLAKRLEHIEADIKHDQEDKNRVTNADTAKSDDKREQERVRLVESLKQLAAHTSELHERQHRLDRDMRQIQRDIYSD